MNGVRRPLILGAVPITIGVVYLVLQELDGSAATVDAAGVTMLIALGLAIGFGMLVILHGARDL